MLTVYCDQLPKSYLLILASERQATDPRALARALHRAGRSGKTSVWVDCSLLALADATPDTGLLLRTYHEAFAAQGIEMVVAHASTELRQCLVGSRSKPGPALVDSLVDASNFKLLPALE
ncbi:hypothetical protein Q3A66_17555 [Hymenobacter sp. BT770]|uniref:hypothetical protein n=1 Tax=Hymenobacter sp. BT770 TaxID=2886942 RepID=UPI001D1202E1|nr:hypothetical protein [Hymenobacter sp. BT770]MCC3154982.1 hypothetical protein [Hymenobacter sp. BT770]MDO3416878.1 hypothetical protein [Hymenobacter sp. BT770]